MHFGVVASQSWVYFLKLTAVTKVEMFVRWVILVIEVKNADVIRER